MLQQCLKLVALVLSLCAPSIALRPSYSSWQHPISKTRLFGDVTITNADTKQTTVLAAGQPLSLGAVRTGLRLSFQCKQGSCGSCEMLLDGKVTRSCITKVPKNKTKITIGAKPKK